MSDSSMADVISCYVIAARVYIEGKSIDKNNVRGKSS